MDTPLVLNKRKAGWLWSGTGSKNGPVGLPGTQKRAKKRTTKQVSVVYVHHRSTDFGLTGREKRRGGEMVGMRMNRQPFMSSETRQDRSELSVTIATSGGVPACARFHFRGSIHMHRQRDLPVCIPLLSCSAHHRRLQETGVNFLFHFAPFKGQFHVRDHPFVPRIGSRVPDSTPDIPIHHNDQNCSFSIQRETRCNASAGLSWGT